LTCIFLFTIITWEIRKWKFIGIWIFINIYIAYTKAWTIRRASLKRILQLILILTISFHFIKTKKEIESTSNKTTLDLIKLYTCETSKSTTICNFYYNNNIFFKIALIVKCFDLKTIGLCIKYLFELDFFILILF
jgi:hypothetical protein